MPIGAMPASFDATALPGLKLIRKPSASSDDASTWAGVSNSSSMSAGSTPRLTQQQPRWSDIVDDCTITDDLNGEVQDRFAFGDYAEAVAPTKSSRRRRGRGARSKLAEGHATNGADESQVMTNYIQNDALSAVGVRDSAAQTLAALGLLISTPGSHHHLTEMQRFGQDGFSLTGHFHSDASDTLCSHAVAEAFCPQQFCYQ